MPALTKRFVDNAPAGRHYDNRLSGFGLYVGKTETRSYFLEYQAGRGRGAPKRRLTIGRHGSPWTPEMARSEAKRLLGQIASGHDPLAERAAEKAGRGRSVKAVVELWLRRDQAGNRTHARVERIFQKDVLPDWGGRPIASITKADVIELVESIVDRGAPVMANRALVCIKRMFGWAAGRDIVDVDPSAHVEKPSPETKRDRVLSDAELRALWRASDDGGEHSAIVRLLALTGQRRQEVGGMAWSELDFDRALWSLPGDRTKNGRAHEVPLSDAALAIVGAQPRRVRRDLIYGQGEGGFSGWSTAKRRLDRDMLAALRQAAQERGEDPDEIELIPWRLHDLRRTAVTRMADLGVQPHVVEAVVNHVSGAKAGVAGIYNRAVYANEKRAALQLWASHLASIIAGEAAKVVPPSELAKRRRKSG